MSEAGDDKDEGQGQGDSTSGCLGLSCGVLLDFKAAKHSCKMQESTFIHISPTTVQLAKCYNHPVAFHKPALNT